MGFPMTWPRLVTRNHLQGDYEPGNPPLALIRGDMRRLEHDARDEIYLDEIATVAGVTNGDAMAVLDAFFTDCGRYVIEDFKDPNLKEDPHG